MKYYIPTLKTSGGYYFIHPNGQKICEPVERKNWPCGIMDDEGCTPGRHLFVEVDEGTPNEFGDIEHESIVKIKTASTTHPGYEIMYMADSGNNLFDSNKIHFASCRFYFCTLVFLIHANLFDIGWIYYDLFSFNEKQVWKARIDGNKACFEAIWWPGHYLGVVDGYLSSEEEEVWWTIEEA